MMSANFSNDWGVLLKEEFQKQYYINLKKKLVSEYKNYTVYPNMYDIFNALHLTSYADTKVVILGQDPYHNENQAHGLSFSVKHGVKVPPSLVNIYKELQSDLGCKIAPHGQLDCWAKQGVLLLNAVLTVRANSPTSHKNLGWGEFTDNIISLLNEGPNPIVFMLWGAFAQGKIPLIDKNKHLIISSAHPSPLSAHRGFFGSKPFSRANDFLVQNGRNSIDWTVYDI